MSSVQYIGEHLMPGRVGHLALISGFVAALTAVVAYAQYIRKPDDKGWKALGRVSFGLHGVGVFTIIGMLFFVMVNKYYEYYYVFSHVSDDLEMRYVFAAFWEGQEGSFLLWMFWHVVLGAIVVWKGGKWEAPVLATLAMIEVFLLSMLLGIHFTDELKIGSNPTLLVRQTLDAPIFSQEDYVSKLARLADGLNPLLQNYWMTIHPPTLFLGFASVSIPFGYAIGGLWLNDHKGWLKPALPWALFSAAILGTGILMGGAWAYEALSFGGYWAWDPVENMSLVPWMVLLAGIHTHLVARATGHSIFSTYLFYIISFLLVLYSTFLTRSGVLGETSVHAFTEMGLEWQLVGFIGFFLILGTSWLVYRASSIPAPSAEERLPSREFWMFIGSLVLVFGAVLITISTSFPVYNKICQYFDPTFEGVTVNDPIAHHNKFQLWVAVFIAVLSSVSQYLRYGAFGWKRYARKFWTHLGVAFLISLGLTWLAGQWIQINTWQYGALLLAGVFATVHNLDYLVNFLQFNLKKGGSIIAHLGFGLMIVGILASGLNKRFYSNPFVNQDFIEGFTKEDQGKNTTLFRNSPLFINGYEVTYHSDTLEGLTRTFDISFKGMDEEGNYTADSFLVRPNILYNKTFEKVAASNPSTQRYWNKDIFTHVSGASIDITNPAQAMAMEDTLSYSTWNAAVGDTLFLSRTYAIVRDIHDQPRHPDYQPMPQDLGIGVQLEVRQLEGDTSYLLEPAIVLRSNVLYQYADKSQEMRVKARIPEKALEVFFTPDSLLDYQTFTLQPGQSFNFQEYTLQLKGIDADPSHPNYDRQSGDIPAAAIFAVSAPGMDASVEMRPLFLIRNSSPFNIKAINKSLGLHLRFLKIDPEKGSMRFAIAREPKQTVAIPLEVTDQVKRSDFIVLQAIEFPGINFFWLGSVLMMLGLAFSMINRMRG